MWRNPTLASRSIAVEPGVTRGSYICGASNGRFNLTRTTSASSPGIGWQECGRSQNLRLFSWSARYRSPTPRKGATFRGNEKGDGWGMMARHAVLWQEWAWYRYRAERGYDTWEQSPSRGRRDVPITHPSDLAFVSRRGTLVCAYRSSMRASPSARR